MKIKVSTFALVFACGLALPNVSMATYCNTTTEPVAAGGFCFYNQVGYCRPGCYCPGGKYYIAKSKGTIEERCKDTTGEYKPGNGTQNVGGGAFRCPSNYPNSDASSKSIEECYQQCGVKIHNKMVRCNRGEFLHYKSETCMKCEGRDNDPSLPQNAICIGGTFYPTCGIDNQGVELCEAPLVPNKERTKCIMADTSIKIDARTYLPANSSAPAACLAGYFCPGAKVEKVQPFEQGIEQCPENTISKAAQAKCDLCPKGTKANEDHTACTDADITVPSGYYLKANSVEPRPCTAPKTYCPGGTFSKSGKDQGVYNCPYESKSNSSHTGCDLYLTKEQMQNGIYGKKGDIVSQCWLKTDINDYKTCVLGGKFQD